MHLIAQHPAALAIVGYWLFSALAGGMPAPTDRSGVAYIWLHNSLQILAGNLSKAVAVRFPGQAEVVLPQMNANCEVGALWLFYASNAHYFSALRQYFAARFPLRRVSPAPTPQLTPTHFIEPGALMSNAFVAVLPAAAIKKPGFFTRFEDEFISLFHEAPSWTNMAKLVINFAAPVVVAFVSIDDPVLLPVIIPVINDIKTRLATASALVKEGSSSAPSLANELTTIQTNFQSLLAMVGVKNDATARKLTANANLVIGEIEALLPQLQPTSVPAPKPTVSETVIG